MWALIVIGAAVVLANLPYLLDFFDPNPLGPRSGLLSSVTLGRLGGAPVTDPSDGLVTQALSHRAVLDWFQLQLPWWNPYEGTGTPLAGGMVSAALFPPTVLTLFANGQLYERMLFELLAGISTYLLLRRISVNRWAGAAAAIAFALNGTFAWFADTTANPVAFLPLLLLGIEIAYAASVAGRRGGWWLIAAAGALSFYAGFPQGAYVNALMAICWFAWRGSCLPRERLRALVSKAASGAIVGTLLAAPLLIAFVDDLNHGDLGLISSGFYGSVHLPRQALAQLVLPYVYGPINEFGGSNFILAGIWGSVGGYLSTSLLLFGLLGIFSKGRPGLRVTLLVWTVLVFARMYGQPPVLGHVLGLVPGMSRVAFFRYATPALELPVVILAALGLDDLLRAPEDRRRLVWGALASLGVLALAVIETRTLVHGLGTKFNHRPYYAGSVIWGASVVVAAVGVAFLRDHRVRRSLLALIVAGDALAMFAVPQLSAPRSVKLDLAPVAFLQRHLGSSRFFTLGPFQPDYGAYFGVASLNANDIPVPTSYAHYVNARLDSVVHPSFFTGNLGGGRSPFAVSPQQELLRNLAGYRVAGVSYVLTPPGQALPQAPETFSLVFRSPSTWIYHLAGTAPYFTATNAACSVRSDRREAVRLSCPRPTQLIRRETDLPGWSANVDGKPVGIREADGLFQEVTVGPGSHRVEFSYLPPNVGWGFLALAVGCAWLLLSAATGRRSGSGTSRP